jgi:hypothetical protein
VQGIGVTTVARGSRAGPGLFGSSILLLLVAAGGCSSAEIDEESGSLMEASSASVIEQGNVTCADLGLGTYEVKMEGSFNSKIALKAPDAVNYVTVSSADGVYFTWSATLDLDAVIVKGGPNSNVYVYNPEATGGAGLASQVNPNTGKPYGLSHISFCYDYELDLSKTASTSYTRKYSWKVVKSADSSSLTLALGQTFEESYTVTASVTGHVDSGYAAAGSIKIYNPAPFAATITGVSDVMGLIAASVKCPVGFPYVLAPGATLTCSYTGALPDGKNLTNTATVKTSGNVGGDTGTAAVDFSKAQITGVDDCVTLNDDKRVPQLLGTLCVGDAPKTFSYTMDIGPYDVCGDSSFINTACFTTDDTCVTGCASATVSITVPCDIGCTLTPGYWKNHSDPNGPAPYDDAWELLSKAQGADLPFFLSGKSYYDVLWTQPAGNAYYILARAYIAAQLNGLNGASLTSVQKSFNQATLLLQTYKPGAVAILDKASAVRQSFISLAGTLDAFNNGATGPGHCSE